jgi:hypothetical protein
MSNEFDNVTVHTAQSLAQRETETTAMERRPADVQMARVGYTADQARQIAEVQVMMTVAKGDPRQDDRVWGAMHRVCKRVRFAEQAKYAFKRGGKLITGLGIKSIRELATIYGNIDYGYRELEREGDTSWVEAYAWDMERNVRVVRKFPVRHWRDKQGGGEEVTAERDKYEVVAGMAQRRVRSCLEQLLPADYLEEAEYLVDKTLKDGDGRPLADRIRDLQVAFAEFGVTPEDLEGFLQHPVRAILPEEIPRLQQIFISLRDGIMSPSEVFKMVGHAAPVQQPSPEASPTPEKETPPQKVQDAPKPAKASTGTARKGRPPKAAQEAPEPSPEPPTPEYPPDDDIPFGNDPVQTMEPELFPAQSSKRPGYDVDGEEDPFA